MFEINEYGSSCNICDAWINPYVGNKILGIILCSECCVVLKPRLNATILQLFKDLIK